MRPQSLTPLPSLTGAAESSTAKPWDWKPFPTPSLEEAAVPRAPGKLSPLPAWSGNSPTPSPEFAAAWPALCALPSSLPHPAAASPSAANPPGPLPPQPDGSSATRSIPWPDNPAASEPSFLPPANLDFAFPDPLPRFSQATPTRSGDSNVTPDPDPFRPQPATAHAPFATPSPATDFTDDDLTDAFAPIVEGAVRRAIFARENGMDTYLEPMLRATIRRALAEYTPSTRPFQPPGAWDRLLWHLQALFTSRTYQDILFEKTHRFQVEEVFLVDAHTLALVSFASCDPARHASAHRVNSTIQRIALQLKDEEGNFRSTFALPDQRHAIARQGRFVTLVAIVRGQPNELILSDLEFSLRRIEDRFRQQFQEQGSALLHPLQPFLEDCLLIQAPASAA